MHNVLNNKTDSIRFFDFNLFKSLIVVQSKGCSLFMRRNIKTCVKRFILTTLRLRIVI